MKRDSAFTLLVVGWLVLALVSVFCAVRADRAERQVAVDRVALDALTSEVKDLRSSHDLCLEAKAYGDSINRDCLKNQDDFKGLLDSTLDKLVACKQARGEHQ